MHCFFDAAIGAGDDAKWLLDTRLKNVWKRLDAWLACIPEEQKEGAAAYVVGALAGPAWLIPAPGAAGMETSPARRIREAQRADTVQMLLAIADEITEKNRIFGSQKITWRNWFYEAYGALQEASDMYGKEIKLSHADWLELADVVTGADFTIDIGSIKDAIRTMTKTCRNEMGCNDKKIK